MAPSSVEEETTQKAKEEKEAANSKAVPVAAVIVAAPTASKARVGCNNNPGVLLQDHSDVEGNWHGVGAACMLSADGNMLYLLGNRGMAVIDFSNKQLPTRVGSVIDTGVVSMHSASAIMRHPTKQDARAILASDYKTCIRL